MKTTPNLKTIFGKFAGKEVLDPNRVTCDLDPVLENMQQVAKKHALTLRVLFPGDEGDCAMMGDRVTATVEQGADGKYRVANFDRG